MTTTIIFIWLREQQIIPVINRAIQTAGVDDVQIYSERCDLSKTAAVNWNAAIDRNRVSDIICILGDDCICQDDWLKNALSAMATLPGGWGMVNLNDGTGQDRTSHVVFHRKCLEILDGKLLHEGYFFCCSDLEMQDRMTEAGRWIFAPDAVAVHYHPMLFKEAKDDKFYHLAYDEKKRQLDRALYAKRKERGWK